MFPHDLLGFKSRVGRAVLIGSANAQAVSQTRAGLVLVVVLTPLGVTSVQMIAWTREWYLAMFGTL